MHAQKTKIGVVGLGMVGETIRRWFEDVKGHERGKNLFCYDTDPKKSASDDFKKADIIFIAVPTPHNPDGSCNVSIVKSVAGKIPNGKTIIIKSFTASRLSKILPNANVWMMICALLPSLLNRKKPW